MKILIWHWNKKQRKNNVIVIKIWYVYNTKKKKNKIANSILQLKSFQNYFNAPEKFIKKNTCNVGDFGIYIEPNGDVFICNQKGSIGNVKNQNLKNIWYSFNTLDVKKKMKKCKKNCEFLINCFYDDEKWIEGIDFFCLGVWFIKPTLWRSRISCRCLIYLV